jgi:vancomycin resistance protein VanJ
MSSPLRSLAAALVVAGVVGIAALEWLLYLARIEGGPLGVLQVFTPHLAIVGLVLAVFAVATRRPAGALGTAAIIAIVLIRFAGDWVSLPRAAAAPNATVLDVVTWNVEVDSRSGEASAALVAAHPADVVALVELQPAAAAAIAANSDLVKRYPYRVFHARHDVLGIGLMSRYPIIGSTYQLEPAVQQATVDIDGQHVVVIAAHPMHADVQHVRRKIPIGINVDQRNDDLVKIRDRIDAVVQGGDPLILLGDLNTAPSEPAYDRLMAGLRDVHAEVGNGTGWTWRPIPLEFLGIGLIRIDYVIVSPDIDAVSIGETCPGDGDHCIVSARLALHPATAAPSASPAP